MSQLDDLIAATGLKDAKVSVRLETTKVVENGWQKSIPTGKASVTITGNK